MTSPADLGSSGRSYSLHLDALTRFAKELDGQAQALGKHSSDLGGLDSVLVDRTLPGDFPEAQSLAEAHRVALSRVKALIDQLKDLVSFADNITVEVAGRYTEADSQAADSFNRLHAADVSPIRRASRYL